MMITSDIRFPTSRDLGGSDAMNPEPDYCPAYLVIGTDAATVWQVTASGSLDGATTCRPHPDVRRRWPGPSGAARLIGDIADISRFASRAHFASWNGTAPIDASSGDQNRHRLSRAGNRRINRVLHIMAVVQLRNDTEGRRYYRRKLAEGKTTMEAMRALKRRLSDVVYRQMAADAKQLKTGPGGHLGATLQSSAADPNPEAGTSEWVRLPAPCSRARPPCAPLRATPGTARA